MIGVDVLMQLIKRYQPIQKHMQGKGEGDCQSGLPRDQ